MNKEEFLSVSLEEQVDYINEQLQQGISFNQVVRDLNVPKTTIFNRINKFYRKEGNAYVPIEALTNQGPSSAYTNRGVPGDRLAMAPTAGMIEEILSSVRKLENGFEEIKHLQDKAPARPAASYAPVTEAGASSGHKLKVDLPNSVSNYTSFQVNKEILNRWYTFSRHQHGYSSSDLVSMALKEFMDKYQK